MKNLKSQGIKAFFWDFFGKMARQGMGFIVSIFLARLLNPSDFGLIAIITVVISIATVFTDIGLSAALVQRRKLLSVHYSSVFYFNLFAGLILTLITYFSANWLGGFYKNEKLIPITQVMSLLFFINSFSSVHNAKLRKELNYIALTKANFIASLLSGGVGLSLAFYGFGVWSLVSQTLSMGMFFNIFIWLFSSWIPRLEFSWKALKQLWGFGFRMFLSAVIASTFERLDFLIVGKAFPTATLGYFERAKSLNNVLVQYSSGSLMAVLFPILSAVQKNLPRFQNIVIKSMDIICFVVFLLTGGLYILSEEIIVLLFSEKWLPSVNFFRILTLSGFGYPISALLVNVLSSRGNSSAFLRLEIYKTTLVALNLVVLYFMGLEIYLYGILITSFFCVLLNMLFAAQEIHLPFFTFLKPFLVQAIISFFSVKLIIIFSELLNINGIKLPICKIILFTVSYFIMNILFKTNSYLLFKDEGLSMIKNRVHL